MIKVHFYGAVVGYLLEPNKDFEVWDCRYRSDRKHFRANMVTFQPYQLSWSDLQAYVDEQNQIGQQKDFIVKLTRKIYHVGRRPVEFWVIRRIDLNPDGTVKRVGPPIYYQPDTAKIYIPRSWIIRRTRFTLRVLQYRLQGLGIPRTYTNNLEHANCREIYRRIRLQALRRVKP